MASVTLKGNPVQLKGELPGAGSPAPDFTFVKADLSEGKMSEFGDKVKVILAVPSLDTGICQIETKKFNEKLAGMGDVQGFVVSMDLPFAMKRFCEAEGIQNVEIASDFRYREFIASYNTELTDGPLKGVSARAVFVVGKDDKISYVELVPEIGQEPDYDKALDAVKSATG